MKVDIGVQYLAFGYPFLVKALASALSLKRRLAWPVSIVTNVRFAPDFEIDGIRPFDHVVTIDDEDKNNRLYKTSAYRYSPFERTVFLDCDTEVVGDLTPADKLLDRYELLARLHSWPIEYKDPTGNLAKLSYRTLDNPHWNSGVLLYKKCANVENFFRDWNAKFREIGYHMDQPSFAETIFGADGLRFQSLDMSWNCSRDFARIHPSLVRHLRVDHFRVGLGSLRREASLSRHLVERNIVAPGSVTPEFERGHSQLRFLARRVVKQLW
jgi:hypothetical protein